ncbi:MAG: hypothetical protein Q4F13_01665 [Pseudomonadota bacterium]|nr:hypothetical protein [Pseudomonadota bacterium]
MDVFTRPVFACEHTVIVKIHLAHPPGTIYHPALAHCIGLRDKAAHALAINKKDPAKKQNPPPGWVCVYRQRALAAPCHAVVKSLF